MLIFELLIEQTLTLAVSPLVGEHLRDKCVLLTYVDDCNQNTKSQA